MILTDEQQEEIASARARWTPTRRSTVDALEQILFEPFPVLDHGFVRVIDYMGDDAAIVQAARVSYGRGTRKIQDDAGLINYLMSHRHTTPFEMCELKLHVKLPIFVARQWIRHRTASVNELSARYSVLDKEYYLPAPEHLGQQSSSNRQGRGAVLDGSEAARVLAILRDDAERCHAHYEDLLDEAQSGHGVARELARINLTLNTYTQWYWKIDLHNLLHFLGLRADPHAQFEIQLYAEVILDLVRRWVPYTHAAFLNYRKGAVTLSSRALTVVRLLLAGARPTQETSGLTPREWRDLMAILGRDV